MNKTNILLKQKTQLILLALATLLLAFTLVAATHSSGLMVEPVRYADGGGAGDPCCPFSGGRPPSGG